MRALSLPHEPRGFLAREPHSLALFLMQSVARDEMLERNLHRVGNEVARDMCDMFRGQQDEAEEAALITIWSQRRPHHVLFQGEQSNVRK